MVDNLFKAPGAPGLLGNDRRIEPFSKHLTLKARHIAPEPPHQELQANAAP